jgi:methionyl-tRNA formyltransferase
MNIIILSNADIASNYALNLLLPKLTPKPKNHSKQHNVKVFLSSKVGKQKNIPEALKELQFFEQTLINKFLFPLIDQQQKSPDSQLKTFKHLETFLIQPMQLIADINSADTILESQRFCTDLIISIRFGQILQDDIIATAKYGVINLHSGLLPQYQGVMPTFRAMLNGDKTIGTCLHYISNKEIDAGEVIANSSMPISIQHSYLWHVLKLYQDGCDNIYETVQQVDNRQTVLSSKPEGSPQYFSFPDEAALQDFQNNDFKLFDTSEINEFLEQYLR